LIEKHIGRYVVRLERKGNAFLYDVLTREGLLVAAGFDLLSQTEAAALNAIAARYGEVRTWSETT
jgi:hypothetical protein